MSCLVIYQTRDLAKYGEFRCVTFFLLSKADVLRIDPTGPSQRRATVSVLAAAAAAAAVRRSNSEPHLNESLLERPDRRESTQSMVNYPSSSMGLNVRSLIAADLTNQQLLQHQQQQQRGSHRTPGK